MALTLLDHGDALSAINADQDAAVARDVSGALGGYVQRPDLAHTAHVLLPQIIDLHAHNAGLITAHWYDGLAPSSKFRAKPFADVPREQVDKVIDWALHAPGDEPPLDRLIGSSQRLVRGASRQTVTRNAAKEGVRWARYAKPTACSFCRALSIRGTGREDHKYLYHSDKSAEFRESDGEKYHTHCACEPIAIREGTVWTPPEYAADWANQYNEAAKSTTGGAKYFQRVVAQMRANDDAKKAKEAEEVAAKEVENLPAPTVLEPRGRPGRIGALNRLQASTNLVELQRVSDELLPDTTVILPQGERYQTPEVQESIKGMVRAVDDTLTRYPDLRLDELEVKPSKVKGAYATAYQVRSSAATPARYLVRFDDEFIADPVRLRDTWKVAVDTGFHYSGSDNPAYDITVHELGHVMQAWAEGEHGIVITDDTVNTALADHFYGTRPPGRRSFSVEAYENWLQDNLSGYSTRTTMAMPGRSNAPNVFEINPIDTVEALAEAFADVEVNGADATETSQVLHALLVGAYSGIDYMEPEHDVSIPA